MGLNIAPGFRITANRNDITAIVADRLVSLRLTDEAGLQSDVLEITLADNDPAQPIAMPPTGAELELWLGYDGQAVRMGLYVVDELELSGPPDQLVIRAKAAPQDRTPQGKTATQTQKTRSWPAGTKLGDMVRTIAGEHGLEPAVSAALDAVELPHVDQVDESDMHLLTRLARDYDAVVKPAGGKLVLARRGDSRTTSGASLPAVTLTPGDVTTWRVTVARRSNVRSVVAVWRDLDGAEDVEVTAGEGQPVMRLRNQHPTREAAEAAARAAWERAQRGERKLSLTMPGRPDLVAEGRVTLAGGFRDGPAGEWLVSSVQHQLSKAGYTCSVEGEVPGAN